MFEYDFMQRAFLAGFIIATLASISGSFVVLKRYSMMTETLAHSALVGVAVGLFAGLSPLWMAVIMAIFSAWLIEYLRSSFHLYSDAILAIFLSGGLALAIIIVSLGGAFNNSLFSYLFGSILAVNEDDLVTMGIFGSISLVLLLGFSKELFFIAYDEEVARTSGIKVKMLNYLLVTVVAVIIAFAYRCAYGDPKHRSASVSTGVYKDSAYLFIFCALFCSYWYDTFLLLFTSIRGNNSYVCYRIFYYIIGCE